MKRKSFEADACPVARPLEMIGDTWSMRIVRQAFAGMRRFSEFEKSLGVACSNRFPQQTGTRTSKTC